MVNIHDIFNLIGVSGIIVVIITGLFNLFNGVYNNKLLKHIERNNAIKKYRYVQLYKMLLYISEMEIIRYNIDNKKELEKTVEKASNEFERIRRKYSVVKSILDKKYYSNLDSSFDREEKMSHDMIRYVRESYVIKFNLNDLGSFRLKIQKKLIKMIQEQIQELTKLYEKVI
jgi:hypothetical protein